MPHLQTAVVPAPGQVVVRLTGEADVSTRLTRSIALKFPPAKPSHREVVVLQGIQKAYGPRRVSVCETP